ncbi:START domain-containing protein [Endozoicomonas sp. SM1973]|uniref:START domain-containing protein n=1 Tax=Spartinivicinus marinus TaxID=2994442 RepID=A0A853IC02_9GAMM|nr:START domain-containing protein [Spartinivicinus marinus]MCX4024610.1 START domain-containing protein [Spartinivicinus marinus]NYZ69382.1 START domain-containing protein [Spartinivicinus marinus]
MSYNKTPHSLIITLAILLLTLANISRANKWQQVKNKEGVKVYTRAIPGSEIHEFKGVTTINTSLASLIGVLDDVSACPQWVYQCTQPTLIQSVSFNERFVYQVNDFPFPSKNRDIILHAKLSQSPSTKAITIQLRAAPDFCHNNKKAICKQINKSKLIRIKKSKGFYLIEPLTKNKIQITWQHHAEPGGDLPTWLVNNLITDTPFYTLKKLAHIVQKNKYQTARLKYDTKGLIVGFEVKNW